jgi:hypothetical protein
MRNLAAGQAVRDGLSSLGADVVVPQVKMRNLAAGQPASIPVTGKKGVPVTGSHLPSTIFKKLPLPAATARNLLDGIHLHDCPRSLCLATG